MNRQSNNKSSTIQLWSRRQFQQWWEALTPTAAFCYCLALLVLILGILGLIGLDPAPFAFAVIDIMTAVPLFLAAQWVDRNPERMFPKYILLGIVTIGSVYGFVTIDNPITQFILFAFPAFCGIAIFGTYQAMWLYPVMFLIWMRSSNQEFTGIMILFVFLIFFGYWSIHREARLRSQKLLANELQLQQTMLQLRNEQQVIQFVRAIYHELGNYVSALQGFSPILAAMIARLLSLPTAEQPEQQAQVESLLQVHGTTTENLRRLTQQMLVASRDPKRMQATQMSAVNVTDLLHDLKVLGDAHSDFSSIDVTITTDCPAGLTVMAQSDYLRMALSTALRNAQDALSLSGCGSIAITAIARDPDVIFIVEDSGPGFPEHVLINPVNLLGYTNKPSGMGIGLTVLQRVAAMHSGRVVFANRIEADRIVGARVSLFIPRG